ncbi:MAG: class I SAM-dependent methyltransferase [Bryobacterales bacterium]|nr:class I SAM-dependent methyltransferase [Bryobacterales bacterium]
MAGALAGKAPGPDYGLDSPALVHDWWHRAGWFVAIGVGVWFINHQEYPGVSARLFAVMGSLGLLSAGVASYKIQSSRQGKLRLRDQLLDQLALQGDEKVLDAGCGLGLMSIGAAKRLKTGKVTAIDTWSPQDLSGNSVEAARENAKAEGVAERIRFEAGNPSKLLYPGGQYDVVVSVMALHRLDDDNQREQALREMLRVLRPGGRLLVFDTTETGYYAGVLRTSGAQDVQLSPWTFLWCRPGRGVSARKP